MTWLIAASFDGLQNEAAIDVADRRAKIETE
jgi:hypothetical protein